MEALFALLISRTTTPIMLYGNRSPVGDTTHYFTSLFLGKY